MSLCLFIGFLFYPIDPSPHPPAPHYSLLALQPEQSPEITLPQPCQCRHCPLPASTHTTTLRPSAHPQGCLLWLPQHHSPPTMDAVFCASAHTSTSIPSQAPSPFLQLTCILEGSFLPDQWRWTSSASAKTTNLQTSLPSTFCNYTFFSEIWTPTSERGLICQACLYSLACPLSALESHIVLPYILELLFYYILYFILPLLSVQSLSRVQLFVTPWTAACQASLSITNSQSLPKLMSIESVMPSSHLIFCCPLLLLPSIFPSIRVFSDESALHIRWPKYWSFSFSISPSNEYSGLISFRIDLLDLFAVQGTLKSLLQHHSSKASILQCSAFFIVQLSHPYMPTGKTIALTRRTFVGKVMLLLFNMLSRLIMAFLPVNKRLLISWLQSPPAVILEPKK